ncbi:glycoside hydrolase family 88 protein [Cellulomonas fimi]|uniref:glycoside hydrolase family 88 protein n=1 Tax=Cellulomonas fimi TaxID=1708 RepID=UPI00235940A1|nr:glycoside hydrolase family 88 protein [Cellulomonas fimi]
MTTTSTSPRGGGRVRARSRALTVLVAGVLVAAVSFVPHPAVAATPAPPSRASVVQAARLAVDHFYATGGGATSDAGWRWAPYFMAVEALHRETGDATYAQWLQAWGERNAWTGDAPPSPTSNPDSRAAIQVWYDMAARGLPADLGQSDTLMAADLALPADRYWWIDAMFMGLPLWPRWATRTGESAYAAKHAQLYTYLRDDGFTTYRRGCGRTGLFDATESLWWRDCQFVPQRDALGHKVFWSRGNGWVLAAMARTLMVQPPTDPQAAEYRAMLQRMAARLVPLQGADGMWRSSLLSPSLYPAPETSGTALFTYAMAYGIRTGLLDAATYLPVVLRAWQGLSTVSLTSTGFVSNCQLVGDQPAAPSTTTSIAYCVGAFALAATEVARLDGYLAADPFTRTATNGLGTAEVGGAWTTPVVPTDFSVDGTAARVRTPAGHTRYANLAGVSSQDTDLTATFGLTRPTSRSLYLALVARQVGSATYTGRAVVSSTGTVQAQAQRSGTTLRAVAVPGLVVGATDRLRLRVQAVSVAPTTVRVRVWKDGTAEPSAWAVTVTDSTAALQTRGAIGLTTYLSADATPSQVVVTVDDLTARRPG